MARDRQVEDPGDDGGLVWFNDALHMRAPTIRSEYFDIATADAATTGDVAGVRLPLQPVPRALPAHAERRADAARRGLRLNAWHFSAKSTGTSKTFTGN